MASPSKKSWSRVTEEISMGNWPSDGRQTGKKNTKRTCLGKHIQMWQTCFCTDKSNHNFFKDIFYVKRSCVVSTNSLPLGLCPLPSVVLWAHRPPHPAPATSMCLLFFYPSTRAEKPRGSASLPFQTNTAAAPLDGPAGGGSSLRYHNGPLNDSVSLSFSLYSQLFLYPIHSLLTIHPLVFPPAFFVFNTVTSTK